MIRLIVTTLIGFPLLAQLIGTVVPSRTLKDALNLTSDQAQKINPLFTDYDSLRQAANARMRDLNSELYSQFSQPAPDPAQVGADYAEAEAIRRNLVSKQEAYRAQVRAVLTPAQVAQFQILQNSITLQPLLAEAVCAFLESAGGFASFLLTSPNVSTVPTFVFRSGDFSSVFILSSPILP